MELVYLWVEKYKNIKEQEFNFSPSFECKYENDKLIILKKNEDKYIKNFFGDKINITAIVGKNGSGKSNLMNLLFNNDKNVPYIKNFFYITHCHLGTQLYYFIRDNLALIKSIKIGNKYDMIKIKQEAKEDSSYQYNFSMIFFSNTFDSLPIEDDKHDEKFDNISTSYLIDKYTRDIGNKSFSFKAQYNFYKSKNIVNSISLIKSKLELPFKRPKELNIVTNNSYREKDIKEIKILYDSTERKTFSQIVKRNIIYNYYHNYLDNEENKKKFSEKIKNFPKNKEIEESYKYIKQGYPLSNEMDDFLEILNGDIKEDFFISKEIKKIDEKFIESLEKLNKSVFDIFNILEVLHFNWKPDLSSGQEAFLFQFANFYQSIKKDIIQDNLVILIDEGETTFHPQWQKEYISYYIKFLKNNFPTKNFHIIFTTHSPFLLSDIPKENIIFLNDTPSIEQTFGANIHTLLSDSFFMNKGLMGEFAKNKIEKIMKFLNSDKNITDFYISQQQIKLIIESIGEDLLRMKLLDMYHEKFEEDELEKEKQQLIEKQKEITELIKSIEEKQKK